jgi:predicted SAM-dependent methyltransferase
VTEQDKAKKRRIFDPRFRNRWFVGDGIDIGCGPDPLKMEDWPNVTRIWPYDKDISPQCDGQYLTDIPNESFDFVHSSHCLEHLPNTRVSLTNWIRILKPGGFIVCTIPEEVLYEQGKWPSRWNPDHKVSFTMRSRPVIPMSTNIASMLWRLPVDLEHLTLLTDKWDVTKVGIDQTLGEAECAIEFVVRKPFPVDVVPPKEKLV